MKKCTEDLVDEVGNTERMRRAFDLDTDTNWSRIFHLQRAFLSWKSDDVENAARISAICRLSPAPVSQSTSRAMYTRPSNGGVCMAVPVFNQRWELNLPFGGKSDSSVLTPFWEKKVMTPAVTPVYTCQTQNVTLPGIWPFNTNTLFLTSHLVKSLAARSLTHEDATIEEPTGFFLKCNNFSLLLTQTVHMSMESLESFFSTRLCDSLLPKTWLVTLTPNAVFNLTFSTFVLI